MDHFATTAVVFVAILGVLVLFHEFGHYAMAKLVGMKVEEFAFGFGPVLAKLFRRGETLFTIRLFPLGGFVKITGMDPGDEAPGGYNASPIWARALTIFAGPFMSLLLGYVVFLMIGFVWGFPSGEMSTRVAAIQPGMPAAKVGLRVGDRIVSIDGKPVRNGDQLLDTVHSSAGKELTIVVGRDGKTFTVKATPKPTKYKEDNKEKTRGLLGFMPDPLMKRTGIAESVQMGSRQAYGTIHMLFSTLFSKDVKDGVGGPVLIGKVTSDMVRLGPHWVFMLLGSLSLTLGVINLFPIPLMDGSHLVLLLVEKIRGRKLEPERMYIFQLVGLVLIIGLAIFMVYYDIFRLATGKI